MNKANEPIIMAFPLRGEWLLPNTPGTKVPSHGTNRLGSRYAYDFIQVDWTRKGYPSYKGSLIQYLTIGIPLNQYYCWGQNVYAPCDGIVIKKEDGFNERSRTNFWLDSVRAYKNALFFDPKNDDVKRISGNYIIIKFKENIYAALVHLQKGSIQVSVGQHIKKGAYIGNVGHSGNSYMPHLHFQLMDSSDITNANGLPCAFNQYEVGFENRWQKITHGIPTNTERIRFTGGL